MRESTNDLISRVSDASMYLISVTPVQGTLGTEIKVKSLFRLWTHKVGWENVSKRDCITNSTFIQRDSIIWVT